MIYANKIIVHWYVVNISIMIIIIMIMVMVMSISESREKSCQQDNHMRVVKKPRVIYSSSSSSCSSGLLRSGSRTWQEEEWKKKTWRRRLLLGDGLECCVLLDTVYISIYIYTYLLKYECTLATCVMYMYFERTYKNTWDTHYKLQVLLCNNFNLHRQQCFLFGYK